MTDTAVLTLADFLLARIDDEHTVAIDALAMRSDLVEPDTRVVADGAVAGGPAVVVGVERMLADCEARRRIVTDYKRYRAEWPTGDESPAVLALALPYTEHPDFRPEWRA